MKIYHPKDKLMFGKNKGHSLADIYQYQPDYIEWLMEYLPDFVIELSEFEQLPKPTPYAGNIVFGKGTSFKMKPIGPNSIKLVKEANEIEKCEIDFKFSENFLKILDKKLKGEYKAPEYKKSELSDTEATFFVN